MATTTPRDIMIEYLQPNPWQPRHQIDPSNLRALVEAIKKYKFSGYLEARPDPANPDRFQLVFGHRRARAAQLAGMRTVPVMLRDYDDQQMAELALLENTTQEPLNFYEEGLAFRQLMQEFGYSVRELAKIHGVSYGYVTNRLAVADLEPDSPLVEAARSESVNMTTIQTLRQMMRERPMEEVLDLLERAKRDELSGDDVREIRASYQATIPNIIAESSGRPPITVSLADQERARQDARDAERARGEEFYREFTAAQRSGELPPVTDAPFMEAPTPEPIRVHARLIDPEEEHWVRIAPNETTSREAAHHALLQLRAMVPALRAKLRKADVNELPQHEQQEWRRSAQELCSLLGPSIDRAAVVEQMMAHEMEHGNLAGMVDIIQAQVDKLPLTKEDQKEIASMRLRFEEIVRRVAPVATVLTLVGGDRVVRRSLYLVLPLLFPHLAGTLDGILAE